MNAHEMTSAIQKRLRELRDRDKESVAGLAVRGDHWICPIAVAATGVGCLAAAATLPLTAIQALPIVATTLSGASFGSALAVSTLTKAGIVICGTAFGVPLAVPATLAGILGGAFSGGCLWLWNLAHRTAGVWAVGLHWIGIGLVVTGLACAVYVALRYAFRRNTCSLSFAKA